VEWAQPPSFSYGFEVSDPASAGFLYSWGLGSLHCRAPVQALPRSPAWVCCRRLEARGYHRSAAIQPLYRDGVPVALLSGGKPHK